ncbi:MAG: hypothetical protein SFU99_21955 [Saprospiraceae bacterium]|nr:hypothetical protein [Saprospiraceae bacterium]
MEEQHSKNQWWLYVLLFGGFLLLSMRFLVALRFLFIPLALLGGVGVGAYFLWKYFRDRQKRKIYLESVEGVIAMRLAQCEQQMASNQAQIEDIQNSIAELNKKRNSAQDLSPRILKETENLINSFRAELKLRESKLAFFETCHRKLEQMLRHHELSEELEIKKEQLKSLQEHHYEDLAQMEELKANVEMEVLHLDTIENLSRRIVESTSYNDAERLRAELNEMTESLDRL